MKMRYSLPLLFLVLGAAGSLFAQDASDGKSYNYHTDGSLAHSSGQSAQDIEDIGEIDEAGAKSTLRDKFRINFDLRSAYTTNALLRGNHSSSDVIFLPTLDGAFHTAIDKHFNFDLDTKVESAIYSKYQDHGFFGLSAQATVDYHIANGLPRFYATLEPYRYVSFNTGQLQTEAMGYTGGTDWGIPFNGGRTLGFIGYSFTDYQSDPNIDTREVHRVVAGFAHQVNSKLTAQLYYLYQYSYFTDFPRNDSQNSVAGNLVYQFNDHWYASWTASFINNESSEVNAGYQLFSTSLGISLHF
jgi:hypothetical protein